MTNKPFNIEEFVELQLRIIIDTPTKKFSIDPSTIARIDEDNIKEELKMFPTQYCFFATLYLDTKKKKDLLDLELDELKTDLAKEARANADDENRKITNPEVKDYVTSREEVRLKERQLINLNNQTTQLYYLCKSLDKKHDSLKSLSFIHNKEDKIDSYQDNDDEISIDPHKYEKHTEKNL